MTSFGEAWKDSGSMMFTGWLLGALWFCRCRARIDEMTMGAVRHLTKTEYNGKRDDMLRLVILFASIAFAGLFALDAYAWMDEWAPPFKSSPADFRELSHDYVTNFVSTLKDMDGRYYYRDDWQNFPDEWWRCAEDWDRIAYSKGAAIDLNGDGVDDYVFIVPRLGCGLAAYQYWAHFIVSDGAGGQKENVVVCYDAKLSDLVKAGGKAYFRQSDIFGDFEKSKHNHWVYQLFSFAKDGVMRPGNGDFGKLFPAVTIYYYKPKFKQIKLTKKDLKEIEDSTVVVTRPIGREATEGKKAFDLLNYRHLWNTDAEKARMVVNPALRKKEADGWKPPRKLTADECTKMMRILAKRFGEPARCRIGYASFVYIWRFEGDEWLSIGVVTSGNLGGDPIAISHWEWRKPELSVYDAEEAKIRKFCRGH